MAHARQEQPDPLSTRQHIGAAIRSWRQQQGLTLSELAMQAEISVSYLSRLEAGRSIPSFALLARLANVLGEDVNSLIAAEHEAQELDLQLEHVLSDIGIPESLRDEFFALSVEARTALLTSLEGDRLDDIESKQPEIFRDYDPQEVRSALAATAGSWQDIDTDEVIDNLYRARGEGSRSMSRP